MGHKSVAAGKMLNRAFVYLTWMVPSVNAARLLSIFDHLLQNVLFLFNFLFWLILLFLCIDSDARVFATFDVFLEIVSAAYCSLVRKFVVRWVLKIRLIPDLVFEVLNERF